MILVRVTTAWMVFLAAFSSVRAGEASPRLSWRVQRRLTEVAEPIKAWIFLTDKGLDAAGEARAVRDLESTYPARALARREARRTRPGLVDATDLPVAPAYVAVLESQGACVCRQSRWLNAVSVWADASTLARIAAQPFVKSVDLVARSWHPDGIAIPAGRVESPASFYGSSQGQLDGIQIPALHALGFTGQGVVVGILDTGFRTTHTAFHDAGHPLQVVASYDFVDDDPVVAPEPGDYAAQHEHGTLILGTLAAYEPNVLVGGAYDASFILCKTEDVTSETQVEEDNYVAGLEFIELNGGDLATSSLGYIDWYTQADLDGQTAVTTVAVNVATANGLFCCTAAGNAGNDLDPGTSSLIAPADAYDVITVGAVYDTGELAGFSSDGFTADGRVKPEILAQGVDDASVWPYDDVSLAFASGTSLSTPLVAGAVACLIQAGPTWDVATMRDRLTRTASYFGLPRPDPLSAYGWGIAAALAAEQIAGSWQNLGGGIAGTSGVPLLAGSGSLVGTETVTLSLSSARPSATTFFVLGFSELGVPFQGGTLWPAFDLFLGLPVNGAGQLALSTSWVPGLPSGFTITSQHWIADPAAAQGFAASNGLRGVVP